MAHFKKGHSFCKQWMHNLQFMKTRSFSPNLSKLGRSDISCHFMKTRSLCRTVHKMNGFYPVFSTCHPFQKVEVSDNTNFLRIGLNCNSHMRLNQLYIPLHKDGWHKLYNKPLQYDLRFHRSKLTTLFPALEKLL